MAKQLIATLTTDSNGEATYNYTGVGAGETTFIAESGELESNSLTIYDILMELTVVSDKDILSYADGDTATITATLEVEGQPAPNNMIVISKYPDFFDGTYFYIPFEQGEENWEIYFGGTIQVLREDKTLYNSFSGTAYISYKAEYESVSMAQYMQESFSLSDFPEKGFICLESPTQIGSISGFDIQRLYTDNSGTVNITYESEGAGDVCLSIIAVYGSIFLQETFSICDAKWYNTLTDSSADSHLIKTGVTYSYTSNGLSVTNGNWKEIVFDTQITQGTSIEYDITQVGGTQYFIYKGFFDTYSQGNIGITNYPINTTGHVKIVYQNNKVQLWLNDVLQTDSDSQSTSPTVTTTPLYYKMSTGGNRTFTIKNIMIKPL